MRTCRRDEYVPGWQLLLSLLASLEIVRRDAAAQQPIDLKQAKGQLSMQRSSARLYVCVCLG